MNVRDLTMRSPRPSYGRVSGIYDPQGSTRYGRLGSLTGGQIYHNSYTRERVSIKCMYMYRGVHRVMLGLESSIITPI